MIEVEYRKGLYLPELDLWLDPHKAQGCAFVSHAHYDHYAQHQRIITGEVNASLVQARFGIAQKRIHAFPYETPREESGYKLEVLPAGHIYGSSMLHVTRLTDGATLLYTGDYKLRPGLSAEAIILKEAETFITETTFGLPKYVFPSVLEVQQQILNFVKETLKEGFIPVLYGYSLGKAQEAIALMELHDIPVVQHKTVAKMTSACRDAGLKLKEPVILEQEIPEGTVIVAPPNYNKSKRMKELKGKRTAMLSGWGINPSAKYRYRTDAVIPLSDHADYGELLEAVETVKPKKILTVHGSTREFAADLRSRGYEAWSIYGNDQLELSF